MTCLTIGFFSVTSISPSLLPLIVMNVPTVTPDDLAAFHSRHFSSRIGCPQRHLSQNLFMQEPDTEDSLGCYADGMKRTLTDEQVAMFRHTEVQRLLKEKRQQGLPSDAERHDWPEKPCSPRLTSSNLPAKRRAPPNSHSSVSAKLHRSNDSSQWTHRRIARELDEDKTEAVELDY